MASTAGNLARRQLLRHHLPFASCSYTPTLTRLPRPRSFTTTPSRASSWPANASDSDAPPFSPSSSSPLPRSIPTPPKSKTISDLLSLKSQGTPIVCLTASDYPTALSIRSAPIDLCLVGDSLANVALGFGSTQSLTLEGMIHHAQAVMRGLNSPLFSVAEGIPPPPLVVADVPFGTTFSSVEEGVKAVVRLVQETGVDGVKIEGSYEVIPLVKTLTDHGILVMGHLGLQPQRVGSTSGYRVQGKTASSAKAILDASLALQSAGCFSIVLECIPTKLGEYISSRLTIPTIGIGAGSKTDGQILVLNDMIGDLTSAGHVLAALQEGEALVGEGKVRKVAELTPSGPKFVRNFCEGGTAVGAVRIGAVQAYERAVRERSFPDDEREGYKMKSEEWKAFLELVGKQT